MAWLGFGQGTNTVNKYSAKVNQKLKAKSSSEAGMGCQWAFGIVWLGFPTIW